MKRDLPLVSQFLDMPLASWKARSCGIAALATVIGFYNGEVPDLKELRKEAMAGGAYKRGVGWRHRELGALAREHGLTGKNFDWAAETDSAVWKKLGSAVSRGPVIASIYKDFKPGRSGHLVVVDSITKNGVHYHEPASKTRKSICRHIPIGRFRAGWKKRVIVVRPI